MAPMERPPKESRSGVHVLPAFVDRKTPPSAAPIQIRDTFAGSTAIPVTRPPTFVGPDACHGTGAVRRAEAACRFCAAARARGYAPFGMSALGQERWRWKYSF